MNNVLSRFMVAALAAVAAIAGAAPNPPDAVPTPFTAKELAQGYRDHVILARPLPGRHAAAEAQESREGLRIREKFARFHDLRVIELPPGGDPADAIERLRASGLYEFVEPDLICHVALEPNDPEFASGALWGLKNPGPASGGGVLGADIHVSAAWNIVREAPNVVVAVIDTGVNVNHQDLAGNIWINPNPTHGDVNGANFVGGRGSIVSGSPFDENGHGTHIAGTIGAVGNNGLDVAGIAWRVKIMPLKVFPASGSGAVSDITAAIHYAIEHGAHIINASYGANGSTGFSNTQLAAITAARNAGVIFVAAAGNAAVNMDVTRFYPASHALDNIVTVGNSTRRDELALSTNYGSAVDLFAPGSEIVSLTHSTNTGVSTKSGTSMAAPHASGALALLKAAFPEDRYRQLINRLLRGVDRSDRFTGKAQTGGRLNVFNALTTTTNRPYNDDFASRPRLTGDNLQARASAAGATTEPGEPAHAGAVTSSVWWEWAPSVSGLVSIDTAGSGHDTVLAVYTGPSGATPATPAELTLVAMNDDAPNDFVVTSRLTFAAQAGVRYQIAVGGKDPDRGLVMLNVGTTPINDPFSGALTLTGESTRLSANNAHCSREPGEPKIYGWPGGNSLWYRWTAPRSGRFQMAAVSEDFDPIMAVFTGTSLDALTRVAESDNANFSSVHTGSLCPIEAVRGVTYSIVVDSKGPAISGEFTLTIVDSLWQGPTGDNVTGAPAVGSDGTVYVGSADGSLYAFSPDGVMKWSTPTDGIIDSCSPAVGPDGTVYVGSYDGKFYAVNPTDGTIRWTRNLGPAAPVGNSPALAADGTIYVKAGDGFLYALNSADGVIRWRANVNAPQTYASPSVALDGTVVQGSDDGKLYAFNPDGTAKWTFTPTETNDIYTAPAIDAAGNLYFGVLNKGWLYSVSPAGAQRWIYKGASIGSSSSPNLSPDGATVYFGGYDRKFHAVNTATGVARWTYALGDEVRASSPAVDANGVLYIGCYDYKLYAINPDGTLKRTYDTGGWIRSCPAIFGNTLYVGSNDAKLYAFDIGAPSGGGAWPQYRHDVRRTGRAQVPAPLAILVAPRAQSVSVGGTLTLSVTASGENPLTYEWRRNGAVITGATGATYTVTNVTAAAAGTYTVTVRGLQGSVASDPVDVAIQEITTARLTNLSVRTGAGTDSRTLIVGFAVAGAQPKLLLLRGVGPTLAEFNVPTPLGDPRLELFAGSTLLAQNEDWGGTPELATAMSRVTFPLLSTSKDAALLQRFESAGTYTVQLTGSTGTTGIALAEIYDLDLTDAAAGSISRLTNISARAQIGTGDGVLIAGFTISGHGAKRVLVRGIGPALADLFGMDGVLSNPRLEIFANTTQASVGDNDDWRGTTELVSAFEQINAFRLMNASSRDAALIVTLPPGSYTAQLSGVGGTTGVGLIEVYELP